MTWQPTAPPQAYKELTLTWLERVLMGSPCSTILILFLAGISFFTMLAYWPGWFPFKNYKGFLFRLLDRSN